MAEEKGSVNEDAKKIAELIPEVTTLTAEEFSVFQSLLAVPAPPTPEKSENLRRLMHSKPVWQK